MLSFGTKNLNCINVGEGIVPYYFLVMDDAGVSTERLHYQHVTGTDRQKKTGPAFDRQKKKEKKENGPAFILTAVPVKFW